ETRPLTVPLIACDCANTFIPDSRTIKARIATDQNRRLRAFIFLCTIGSWHPMLLAIVSSLIKRVSYSSFSLPPLNAPLKPPGLSRTLLPQSATACSYVFSISSETREHRRPAGQAKPHPAPARPRPDRSELSQDMQIRFAPPPCVWLPTALGDYR